MTTDDESYDKALALNSAIRAVTKRMTDPEVEYLRELGGPAEVAQALLDRAPEGMSLPTLLAHLAQLMADDARALAASPWHRFVAEVAMDELELEGM